MARESEKKIAAHNTATLNILRWGMLSSNVVHLFSLVLFRASKRGIFAYLVTEGLALLLWLQLRRMSTPTWKGGALVRSGEDLAAPGLTQYMLDVLYVTFATHILTALVWRKFWWLYAAIPGYALYMAWTMVLAPRLGFGKSGAAIGAQPAANAPQSKRQAKLQARAQSGDPRVRNIRQ